MELKLDFNNIPKLINERNRKVLFLFLQLPWLLSAISSISATSQGLVLILTPSKMDDSFLGLIFKTSPNTGTDIIAVAICNFVVELILFLMLMSFENRFEINKTRVVILLLTGQILATSLYFISLTNENARAATFTLTRLFYAVSTYYIIFRYLPRKYLEILVPYSVVFATLEIQTLKRTRNTPTDNSVEKYSKRRLKMYVKALLLALVDVGPETNLIELLRKQRAIDQEKSNNNKKVIQDFCNYLHSSFSIQIPVSEIIFEQETRSKKFLQKVILLLDNFSSGTLFTATTSSIVLDLTEKSTFPVTQNDPQIPTSYNNKNLKRIIRYHLDCAKKIDAISAKQKLYAFIIASFLYLVSPTINYILILDDTSSFSNYNELLLAIQYISIFILALFTTNSLQMRFREAGIDVLVPNKLFGYLMNSIQFLLIFALTVSTDEITYKTIIPILSQNMMLLLIGIVAIQMVFLFIFFKPPAEFKKSSVASSLLVRELLYLRFQILESRYISNRRQVGRYIYFAKKYLTLIAKDLIYSRFDTASQKTHLREYFRSISDYLDNLSAQIKLGGEQNRVEATNQIETLILFVAVGDFGEIPNAIPEFQKHMEIKSIQPKPPSLIRQVFQVLDTSASARTFLIILVFIVINLLNPSLWLSLQNISSLFQLLTP